MTQLKWRVFRAGSRLPRDFLGTVHAPSAAEAIASMRGQPHLKGKDIPMDAVPAHPKREVTRASR